jgi:hypothetical protein
VVTVCTACSNVKGLLVSSIPCIYELHVCYIHKSVLFNIFPQFNQQDSTFLNLFISIKRSTCFRRFLHPSSGAQTVRTASGIVKPCCYHGWDGTVQFHPSHGSSTYQQGLTIPEAVCTDWAPDDGRRNRLKLVERFIEINKLKNVASCGVHFGLHIIVRIQHKREHIARFLPPPRK